MKTSRLSALLIAAGFSLPAGALNRFDCLRDLMPITEHGIFLHKRKGVEDPFAVSNGKYIVFPEISGYRVSGFYIYNNKGGWFYDAVEVSGKRRPLKELEFDSNHGIYELTAQPDGLETVSVQYLPGFDPKESDKEGPVMLGSSVLPVVGAMISRPAQRKVAYHNPAGAYEADLKKWMAHHHTGRSPASAKTIEITRSIFKMHPSEQKRDIWAPLDTELKLRKEWIKTRNLDEQTFRDFNRLLQTSCAETP